VSTYVIVARIEAAAENLRRASLEAEQAEAPPERKAALLRRLGNVLTAVQSTRTQADGVRRSIEAANRRARVGAPVTDPSRPAMQPGHQAAMQGGAA